MSDRGDHQPLGGPTLVRTGYGAAPSSAGRRTLAGRAAGLALVAIAARASADEGTERLRSLLQGRRGAMQAEDETRRLALVSDAEAHLATGDTAAAARLFEQAGFVRHAADAEIGLIRTWMQQGQYRRALAFAAHAALAHTDVPAGAALYAWLLHVGGQSRVARDLVAKARLQSPDALLLAWLARAIDETMPVAPPHPEIHGLRLAPYPVPSVALARVTTSGVVIGDGTRVLAPAQGLRGTTHAAFVRDGLGHVRAARIVREDSRGFVELALAVPAAGAASVSPARDPVPGAPVSLIGYARGQHAAWPHLQIVFPALPRAGSDPRRPRIVASGLLAGAAVFDASGRLAGLVGHEAEAEPVIIPPSVLFDGTDLDRMMRREPGPGMPLAIDAIYERGMGCAVQVLAGALP